MTGFDTQRSSGIGPLGRGVIEPLGALCASIQVANQNSIRLTFLQEPNSFHK